MLICARDWLEDGGCPGLRSNHMTWRFRKSFKVLPGVRLNLTKRGLSATVGAAPFSVNFGPRGVYSNVSIPGTGLWDRERLDTPPSHAVPRPTLVPDSSPTNLEPSTPALIGPREEIRSASTELLNSESMNEFRDLLRNTYEQRSTLDAELASASREFNIASNTYQSCENGFLLKHLFGRRFREKREALDTAQAKVNELSEQLKLTKLAAHFEIDREQAEPYFRMRDEFAALSECQKIWDTLSRQAINRFVTRSAASEAITRDPVRFDLSGCDVLQWDQKVPHLPNKVGGDLYVYPGFVLYRASKQAFALIDFHEVKIEFRSQRFVEDEPVPPDSQVVGQAWAKSNKEGSPDRRFHGNYQIPIVFYGEIVFKSVSGLHEEYQFSNPALAQRFVNAWDAFHQSFAPVGTSGHSSPHAIDVKSVTAQLRHLLSTAISALRNPPENKNADEYLRAELLHLVLHFAAFDGEISMGEAQVYGEIAVAIDPEMKDTGENNRIFLKGLMEMGGSEELKRPPSLSLIEQADRESNGKQAIQARVAFFEIALAVIAADGMPTVAAKAEVMRFSKILGAGQVN